LSFKRHNIWKKYSQKEQLNSGDDDVVCILWLMIIVFN